MANGINANLDTRLLCNDIYESLGYIFGESKKNDGDETDRTESADPW